MEPLIRRLAVELCDGLLVKASSPRRAPLEQAIRLALLAVVHAWRRSIAGE